MKRRESSRLWTRCCGLAVLLQCLLAGLPAHAQISSGGQPRSFSQAISSAVPTIALPAVDHALLLAEDRAELEAAQQAMTPIAPRIAFPHEVNLNLTNAGTWTTLGNGDRIWRLRIETPGSYSIMLVYDRWQLPKGAELFLYDDEQTDIRGAFTHENNWIDGTNITAATAGDAVTLELYIPAWQPENGELSISTVGHVYRTLSGMARGLDEFGDAESCHINVNCPEGANWQDEKRGVAMIVTSGFRWCSGSLIRNACNTLDPLFLTAHHCLDGNQTNWVFIFNYESAGCPNPGSEPSTAQSISNSTQLGAWGLHPGGDFALLRLSSSPPATYNTYINGWDRNNVTNGPSVGIHHPAGDIKKIYGDDNTYISTYWNDPGYPNTHWQMEWDWGAMIGGSSGSPLFNPQSRVVGDLTGGYPGCFNPNPDYALYGKISFNWEGGGTAATRLRDWLDPCNSGVTVIDGTYPPTASNDNCSSAQYVGFGPGAFPYTHSGNTTGAANDYGAICRTFPGPDVVYYWYSGCCSTNVTLSLCGGSTWDTGLFVRSDSCNGVEVACNDDFCGSPALQSQTTFLALPNRYYYFFVDGFSATSFGPYTLNITGATTAGVPSNDNCAGSIAVSSLPYSHSSSTCAAAINRSNCISSVSPDVYYSLTLPTCQTVTVTTCGTNCFDTALEVLTGGACPGTTQVACNDDNFCGLDFTLQSTVSFVATANQTYYIIVHGFNIARGAYTLNVTGVPFSPPNDECAGSTVIAALPYSDSGNTLCANASRLNCVGFGAPDVFYTYTSDRCQQITTSLCGSGYDSRIEVRSGGACPGDIQIGCNDDFCGLQSQLTFNAAEGVTYYFIVNGYITNAGPFVLNVTTQIESPTNNLCAGATPIFTLPFDDVGSTTCASNEYTSGCGGTMASNDVVYRLYIGNYPCQNVLVTLCGSNYDTGLHVYSGSCDGTEVVCNDDAYCGSTYTLQSSVIFTATPFTDYWIVVDGYATSNYGVYRLHADVSCQPESLVVQRMGATNDVRLTWAPPRGADGGLLTYRVYRSNTFPVAINAGNLIATQAFTPQYTDAGRVTNPALQSYYAVTCDVTPFLSDPGDTPVASVPDMKLVSPDEQAAMNAVFIPAYIDPTDIQGPNPNKPEVLVPQPR